MKAYHILFLLSLICLSSCSGGPPDGAGGGGGHGGSSLVTCDPYSSEECPCPDGSTVGVRFCKDDGSAWSSCADSLACRAGTVIASSSSSSSCQPISRTTACEGSECGLKPDGCGGAHICGTDAFPYCNGEPGVTCISSATTAGVCAKSKECVHLADMDAFCSTGKQLIACNGSVGHTAGSCAPGTGVCEAYAGENLNLNPGVNPACCTPCG